MGGCRPEHQPQQPCPSRGTEGRGREVRPSLGCGREDLEVPPPRGLRTCSHPAADTAGLSWAGHITRQTARPESEPEKRSFAKAARTAHAAPMHETLQTDIRRLRSRHSLASRERRVPRCADTHLRLPSCRSSATEFPHLTAAQWPVRRVPSRGRRPGPSRSPATCPESSTTWARQSLSWVIHVPYGAMRYPPPSCLQASNHDLCLSESSLATSSRLEAPRVGRLPALP